MKVCRICNQTLPLTQFYAARGNRDKLSNRCNQCEKEYQQVYKNQNRQHIRQRAVNKRKARWKLAIDTLGGACSRCGGKFPPACYDLHHKNPKEKEVTLGENMLISEERFLLEVSKCELLCSNCHRIVHWEGSDNESV